MEDFKANDRTPIQKSIAKITNAQDHIINLRNPGNLTEYWLVEMQISDYDSTHTTIRTSMPATISEPSPEHEVKVFGL